MLNTFRSKIGVKHVRGIYHHLLLGSSKTHAWFPLSWPLSSHEMASRPWVTGENPHETIKKAAQTALARSFSTPESGPGSRLVTPSAFEAIV